MGVSAPPEHRGSGRDGRDSSLIVTVTLNPAIDQTIEVERFIEGDTNRVDSIRYTIGGKGIRVARVLKELGYEPLAMGFAPGASGRMIENQLADSGIGTDFAFIPGETRTNVTIVDREHRQHTVLSARGPYVEAADLDDLYARIRRRVRAETWLVLAGSIPPGAGGEVYARLIEEASGRGAFSALDADGSVVREVLDRGVRPSLLKLNARELGSVFDAPTETEGEVIAAAQTLRALGVPSVVVTRGALGAIALTESGGYRVHTPDVAIVSALGAGDAFLAGLLLGLRRHETWPQALARAAAAGTAASMVAGTGLCRAAEVDELLPRCQVEFLEQPSISGAAAH